MVEDLEAAGLRFVGRDETGTRMEIVELAPELEHPFFVGSQFHPEVILSLATDCRVRAQRARPQGAGHMHQGCSSVALCLP
jgi:CTP synthase (UTP-ammonia lyase)